MKLPSPIAFVLIFHLSAWICLAADNVFLPPNGGDLTDADNWSLGVVPGTGVIDGDETKEFVLGSDVTGMTLRGTGDNLDWSIDLNNKVWNGGGNASVVLNSPIHQNYSIKNGTLQNAIFGRENFFNYDPGDSESAHVSVENVDWNSGWNLQVTGENTGLIDNGSSVQRVLMVGESAVLEVKGGSTLGDASDPEVLWLEGTEIAKLVVDDGSKLVGGIYRLNTRFDSSDPIFPAELTIRGGSKTFAPTDVRISPNSTTIIEGNGTVAEFETFHVSGPYSFGELNLVTAPFIVRDGAKVAIVGPPNPTDSTFPVEPSTFRLGQVSIFGEGSALQATGYGGNVMSLEVKNSGTFVSEKPVSIFSDLSVENASVQGSFGSVLGSSTTNALGLSNDVEIIGGILDGSLTGFGLLSISDSTITGDVTVQKIIGNGRIDGDVLRGSFSSDSDEIIATGLLSIGGDLRYLDRYILEVREFGLDGHGTLSVDGLFANTSVFSLINLPPDLLDIRFANGFSASVGDVFPLLATIGTSFDLPKPPTISDPNWQIFLNQYILGSVTGLPEGYAINVYVHEHEVGFIVSAVPEVSTIVMVGVGLFLIVAARIRGYRRMAE